MSYCELHKHSTWSLLDGVGTAEHGARRAAELGHPALAMTEHAVLSGTVHHIDACREVGVTPIVGVEAYYRERRQPFDKETNWEYFHMLLLAKNIRGWRSLCALTSEAYRCVTPETRVLTSDLRWVPAGDLRLGDTLVGYDQQGSRNIRQAIVTNTGRIKRRVYRIVLKDGTELRASSEHPWLCMGGDKQSKETNVRWRTAQEIYDRFWKINLDMRKNRGKDRLVRYFQPWEAKDTRDAGYVAGVFDGEGHICPSGGRETGRGGGLVLGMTQNPNVVLDRVQRILSSNGAPATRLDTDRSIKRLNIVGGRQVQFEFLGSYRPQRLLDNFEKLLASDKLGILHKLDGVEIETIVDEGEQEVVALSTSTETYIAEGFGAHNSGFYRKPCIDDELLDKWHEGLIISTSCVSGFVPRAILRDDDAAVKRHCDKLTRWAGDDWYFEIQPHDFDDLRVVNLEVTKLAQVYGRPIVAARDAHAPDQSWIETQHVSVKMRTKGSMVSAPRKEGEPDEKYDMTAADTAYISSAQQTIVDFRRHHPHLDERLVREGIDNTGWVAGQIVPWLMDRSSKMPRYHDTDEADYQDLRRQIYAGLEQLGHRDDERYVVAAEKELKIFREKRFCAFFLLLADMIRWLRSTDPLPATPQDQNPEPKKPQKVGLGRGSAGGCVTAYATRITLINPITYGLSFERFLNPDRTGLPDVDIDLTREGADLAKEWLKRKKGDDRVYDLISHGTMGPKAAIRRVGMVYEVPHPQLNVISKMLPDEGTLEVMLDDLPDLQRFAENNPDVWRHAVRLQGSVGTQSEHAAGVIVSDIPMDELMPVMKKSAKDGYLVTAFGNSADKEIVADLGFLKVDLLVVVALARQDYAEQLIGRVHDKVVDLDTLPALEDPRDVDSKTMDIFAQGRIRGVFQWDGFSNMASITKQIKPESIFHLAAANAGVRPGVSRSIDEYVRRRHGAEFEYWDLSVEPALAETFGLPLYQEQIMAIFEHLGGYSAAEADTVRRIMGKYYRIKGDVAARMLGAYEERFVANAAVVCHGGQAAAETIWNYCGNSSSYLFNKSHADEYSLIAYGDGWLKAHYPDAFYASLLSFPPAWVKKPENRSTFYERTVREARSFGVDVLPPDVNVSDEGFTIHGNAVRFGLKGVKGLGRAMVADVLNNRPFSSMEDLGARLVACNAAGRHALAQAGALDRFGARENLTQDEQAQHEEDRIGVALSTPDRLVEIRDDLRAIIHTQDEVDAALNGSALVVGGEVIGGREVATRKGPSLKLTVAFDADEYQVSVAPWFYDDELRELIATDEPIVVRGAKDTAWDCVSADEIKLAREVLDMMQPQLIADATVGPA